MSDVNYAVDSCLRVLVCSALSSHCKDLRPSEVKASLLVLFDEDTVEAAATLASQGVIPPYLPKFYES